MAQAGALEEAMYFHKKYCNFGERTRDLALYKNVI